MDGAGRQTREQTAPALHFAPKDVYLDGAEIVDSSVGKGAFERLHPITGKCGHHWR